MEKYLPEWFDEKEFEAFLAEGRFTRQAWIKNIQRWRRTKFMLRRMIGSTPMKSMKKAMQQKYAIMARTAAQNARDIQAAQNREQSMKRNFAEENNIKGNELIEKLNSGSTDTFFSLGNKTSPGEQARNKVPFGNEKAKARWKKRFQRRLMKARGMKVEDINYEMIEEAKDEKDTPNTQSYAKDEKKSQKKKSKFEEKKEKKSPTEKLEKGDFSEIVVVEINGKVKIESWNSVKGKKNVKFLRKRGQIKNKSDLDPYRKRKLKDKFGWTETYYKIFPGDKKGTAGEASGPEEKGKEKKKKSSAKKEEKKIAITKKTAPEGKGKKTFSKQLLPPERQVAPNQLSSEQNKKSVEIAELMMDEESLKKLSNMRFFGKENEQLEKYQKDSDSNPWLSEVGSKNLPRVLNFAADTNEKLKGKELFLLSLDGRQNCFSFSKKYKNVNAVDRSSKADYIVFPKDKLETFAKYLSTQSQECEELKKEIVEESVGLSHKAGKSKLASSYATDTLAVIDEVKNLLMSIGKQLPPELYKLIEDFNKLKSLSDGSNMFKSLNSIVSPAELEKMTPDVIAKLDAQRQSNLVAAQQYFAVSTPIVNDIKKMTNQLFENDVVKAAFVYVYASEKGKFDEKSLGKVDGMIFADDKGEHVGSMNIPATFEEALNDDRFMTFVKRHRMNVRGKSIVNQPLGVFPSPNEFDILSRPGKPLMASFDPLLDNPLDQLFEYTFLPPDKTIEVQSPTSAEGLPAPEMSSSPKMGFSEFSKQEDFKFTPENIFTVLNQVGVIENIDFGVLDYTDVGMQLSSLQSPITNTVVVNGKEYKIPVYNIDLDENLFNEYDALNEMVVQMVEDGIPYDGARSIFLEELNLLLEKKKRNYKREYALFHSKPVQRKKRSNRVLARRKMAKRFGKRAIAGKDIDHKDGNALNNGDSNLRVRSINKNRSDNGHSRKTISEKINWWNNLEGCGRATEKRLKLTPGQWDNMDLKLKQFLLKDKGACR